MTLKKRKVSHNEKHDDFELVIFEEGQDLFDLDEKSEMSIKRKNTSELIKDTEELIENSAAFLDLKGKKKRKKNFS